MSFIIFISDNSHTDYLVNSHKIIRISTKETVCLFVCLIVSNFTEFMKPTEAQMKFHGRPGNLEALESRRIACYWGKEELSCGRNFHSQCLQTWKQMASRKWNLR